MFTQRAQTLDLNGTWNFAPDPMQRCRRQQWRKTPTKRDGIFPCWDMDGLWEIQVSGSWKTQFTELAWYDGHAVYVRDFTVDEIPADLEAFLVFDGIVYTAQVYLNGHLVGEHDWGYSAFQVRDGSRPTDSCLLSPVS
jgi:beta-galactosidase/beta-glucuronidase